MPSNRSSIPSHTRLGVFFAAAIAALTMVGVAIAWSESETEKARDDGRAVGSAVSAIYYAEDRAEVDEGFADLSNAIEDTRDHAGDAAAEQVQEQTDALGRAAEGYVGSVESADDWDQAVYEAELEVAVDDLRSQAEDFRDQGPEVRDAFWDGVDQGLEGF